MKPYIKYWRSALQKSQPYKPRKISTPDECIQQKIRMAESLIICFVMFLINDLYGFVNWKRMEKRQTASGSPDT